eukprot:6170791-Pleurochrysis_carterae.AAC.1
MLADAGQECGKAAVALHDDRDKGAREKHPAESCVRRNNTRAVNVRFESISSSMNSRENACESASYKCTHARGCVSACKTWPASASGGALSIERARRGRACSSRAMAGEKARCSATVGAHAADALQP